MHCLADSSGNYIDAMVLVWLVLQQHLLEVMILCSDTS